MTINDIIVCICPFGILKQFGIYRILDVSVDPDGDQSFQLQEISADPPQILSGHWYKRRFWLPAFKIGDQAVCIYKGSEGFLQLGETYSVENVTEVPYNGVILLDILVDRPNNFLPAEWWHAYHFVTPELFNGKSKMHSICPDCKGTKVYQGLFTVEPCRTCCKEPS